MMDQRFVLVLFLSLSQLPIMDSMIFMCTPSVQFTNCLTSTSKENLLWNVSDESTIVVPLAVNRSCKNSVIEIHWELVQKDTKRIVVDLRRYHNKQVVVFNPKSLPPDDYILMTRVTESSYTDLKSTVERECWIRILKNEQAFTQENDTQLQVETNTASMGWRYCSNPSMYVQYYPVSKTIYFEEIINFDNLINSAHPNNTSPMINSLERKGFEFGVISNLQYNRKYQFFDCPQNRSRSSSDCKNLSEVTTCPNYAVDISCNPSSDFNTRYSYQHVFSVQCELSRNVENYISYGVYSLNGKHPRSKGPADILLAYTTNYRNVNFRLYAGFEHKIRLVPIEYESHVRFQCAHSEHCLKNTATFRVLSDVLQDDVEDKYLMLKMARDGKIQCQECPTKLNAIANSFDALIDLGKIPEAVQLAHMLLRDLEAITVDDLERNKFQLGLLEKFGAISSWSWFDLELMLGLIPFFDMEGVHKEISHTKAKATLLNKMTTSLKRLVLANSHPVTIQLDMEEIFFRCLYRQISQLFESDFVKPFSFKVPKVKTQPFHAGIDEKYPDYDGELRELFNDYVALTENALEALSAILFARSKTHTYKDEHLEAFEPNVISKMWFEYKTLDYLDTTISDVISIKVDEPVYSSPNNFEFRFIWSVLSKDTFFWENSLKNTFPYLTFTFHAGDYDVNAEFQQNPVVEYKVDKVTVPVRFDGVVVPENVEEWRSDVMERFIRVYRIKVDKMVGFTLGIFLSNITPVKRIKAILIQNQRKPSLEDFNESNSTIVFMRKKASEFVKISARGYWYIGVLPFKEDIQDMMNRDKRQVGEIFDESEAFVPEEQAKSKRLRTVSVSYVFAIVSYSCPVWKNGSFQHDICEVGAGTSIEKIECECAEIGRPMTVSVVPMSYKTYGILDIPLELTLVVEYAVVAATLVAVFVYCLLLSLEPCRPKKTELVCFLSDNARSDRYGYIIKVKTGSMVNSGTTSRIGLQLYGTQSESKRHVLNYPDPEHELLQNGQSDLFFLATEKSLGQIERLEIWSDCHGHQPNWYCENIRIYDMQTHHRWYFNVQKTFGIKKGCGNHFYVKPAVPKNISIRSPWIYFNMHFGASHTWNVLNSSKDIYWSYLERLTIMLSHVLCTFSLALYFVNPVTFEYQDGLATGRYNDLPFYVKTIFGVTILVAPTNYFFAVVLRSSKRTTRFRNTNGYYPSAFRQILWFVLLLIIVNCLTYCLVYGPFISYATVYDWSLIVVVSLLVNIFLCENLFLTTHNFIQLAYYWINKKKKDKLKKLRYSEIIKDVESQRRFLHGKTDDRGLRPYLGHFYAPLSSAKLLKRREQYEKSSSLRRTLNSMVDIWMLAFFLFLLIPFYFDEKSSEYERHLRDVFVKGQFYDVQMGIGEVFTYDELYKYLNESIVHAISPTNWYHPYTIGDAAYISDIASKIIGNVNVRQERVDMVDCPEKDVAKQLFHVTKCVSTYDKTFLIKNTTTNGSPKQNFTNWQSYVKGSRYGGILAKYDGCGFSVSLGKSRQNVLYRVKILEDNGWLDERTKLVIIEMLLYSANANLFADVKLIFEREAKLLLPKAIIKPVKLINQDDRNERLFILIATMYFALSVKICCGTVYRVLRKRWSIFTDLFSIGLILLQVLNVAYVALFVSRTKRSRDFLDVLRNSERNKFLSYDDVIETHRQTEICLSLMAFVVILLLLQCAKFVSWTRHTLAALKSARTMFLLLWFSFFRILFSFGVIGLVLFGSTNSEFLSSLNSSMMVILLYVKAGLYESLWSRLWLENGDVVIWIYLTSFVMLSTLKVCFIIVCMTSLRQVRMSTSLEKANFTLDSYISDVLRGIVNMIISKHELLKRIIFNKRIRLRGGVSQTFVTPKPVKYRFKNVVYVNETAIEQQRLVTLAYLSNLYNGRSTEIGATDFELMSNIAESVLTKDSYQTYFKERIRIYPEFQTEMVHDEKFRYMATITEQLLERKDAAADRCSEVSFEDEGSEEDGIYLQKDESTIEAEKMKNLQKNQLKQLACLSEILDETNHIVDVVNEGLFGTETLDNEEFRVVQDDEK